MAFLPLRNVTDQYQQIIEDAKKVNLSKILPSGADFTVLQSYKAQQKVILDDCASPDAAVHESGMTGQKTILLVLLKPLSRGSILINSPDPLADPVFNYGTIQHPTDVQLSAWTFWNALFTIFLYFTFAAIKLSVLMLYLRLLSPAHKHLRFGVWVLAVFNIAILIGTTTGLLVFCHLALKLFRPTVPGTCNVSAVLFVVQGVLSVATDLMILIPPIFVV